MNSKKAMKRKSDHSVSFVMENGRAYSLRAFTLIELLALSAILAILAALLLPSLARAKARAVQIQCVSNYKQVGVALQMYVGESHDRLPPGNNAAAPEYLDLTQRPAYNATSLNL